MNDPCPFAVQMPNPLAVYCRNSHVHAPGNLVPSRACGQCVHRAEPLVQLRPEPEINPTLLQRAKNFGKAGAVHLASGLAEASAEVQTARQAICLACPFWSPDLKRCQHIKCGCSNMSAKWRWASSVCPDNPPRW